jgi:septal ring factor EnvC (AmiA/AmiB activator)
MKRYLLGAMAVVFLLAGPVGCGKRETGELRTRVGQLEQQLADKDKELTEVRARAAESASALDTATAELVKVKVERDKLKKEITALKKRHKR